MKSCRRSIATRGRATRSLIVGLAALAAIAASGGTLYRRFLDRHKDPSQPDLPEIQRPAAAAAGVIPDPDVPTVGVSSSRLAIIRADGPAGRSVVALADPFTTLDIGPMAEVKMGVLARELVRQAVLIAARDELGLETRDEVLGDPPPAGDQGEEVRVVTALRSGPASRACLVRRADSREKAILNETLRGPEAQGELPRLATAAEALSRSGFVEALRALGLEGRRNAWRPDAGPPAGVEERLSDLGYAVPFSAIRDLHEAIRSDGESPARLGALARGYALLGALTEFHWHPAHKVLKARGLLYAQRLAARVPGDPSGLWHRAFAEAMAGLHQDALADLAEARTLAAGRPGSKPPRWVDVIEALARCDTRRLALIDLPEARLAALLRLATLEYPTIPGVIATAARHVVDLDPECFRGIEAMCRIRGVALMHIATALGPQALDRTFPEALRALPRLPEAVRARLDGKAGAGPDLIRALGEAGAPGIDRGEPSWAVLGHMAAETRFLQVYWQLYFMRRLLAVPVEEYCKQARPLVADHRFRPYLERLASPPGASVTSLTQLMQDFGETKLDLNEIDMFRELYTETSQQGRPGNRFWGIASRCIDDVARDLAQLIEDSRPEQKVSAARRLMAVSPHSPHARAILLEHDWDRSKEHLDEWKKEAGDSPVFLAALARHYHKGGQIDEARDVLTRYIRLSPDYWAYEMLAETFKARGDLNGWKSTLDEFLAQGQDYGLDQARARVLIANDLMGRGLWAEAWPYAEAAAMTWAGWAMDPAARCAEGMGRLEEAELWTRRQSERYPGSSWANWFLFCKRTGHGDAEAARDFAAQYLAATGADRDEG